MTTNGTPGDLRAWDSVPAGFHFPTFEVVVDQARQARYHACCDVDSAVFGTQADVSILAQDTGIAVVRAGLPNDGRVHTSHRIRQHRPVGLGEVLVIQGRVEPYGSSRRGRILNCAFEFRHHDGRLAVAMDAAYLLPDGAAPPPRDKQPAAGKPSRAPAEAEAADAQIVATLALTPDKVKAFSHEVGNLIHFDPAFAAARGFRAPLAQGLMQVTAIAGAIARSGPPAELDLEVRFLRPLFWDDRARIAADADARRYRCLGPDGRLAGEGVVHHFVRSRDQPLSSGA